MAITGGRLARIFTRGPKANRPAASPSEAERLTRILLVGILVAILAIAAVVTTIFPRGSGLQQCLGTLSQGNKNTCLYNLALAESNGSVCSYATQPEAGTCFYAVAQKTDNAALCQSSGADVACVSGIVNATGDRAYCDVLNVSGMSKCAFAAAVHSGNLTACGYVSNATQASACVDTVRIDSAVQAASPASCTEISAGTNESVELAALSNLALGPKANASVLAIGTLSDYLAVENNVTYSDRDACYLLLAASANDSSYCPDISNQYLSASCTLLVKPTTTTNSSAPANYTQSIAACGEVGQQFYQACVNYVLIEEAVATKSPSICSTIMNTTLVYTCYGNLARQYGNFTYCDYITNSTASAACITGVTNSSVISSDNGD